jgi:hypothetical protein
MQKKMKGIIKEKQLRKFNSISKPSNTHQNENCEQRPILLNTEVP